MSNEITEKTYPLEFTLQELQRVAHYGWDEAFNAAARRSIDQAIAEAEGEERRCEDCRWIVGVLCKRPKNTFCVSGEYFQPRAEPAESQDTRDLRRLAELLMEFGSGGALIDVEHCCAQRGIDLAAICQRTGIEVGK